LLDDAANGVNVNGLSCGVEPKRDEEEVEKRELEVDEEEEGKRKEDAEAEDEAKRGGFDVADDEEKPNAKRGFPDCVAGCELVCAVDDEDDDAEEEEEDAEEDDDTEKEKDGVVESA
jgi:hypothetical protein